MKKELHTILGASGASGQAVLKVLQTKNLSYRTVSRGKMKNSVHHISADLLNPEQCEKAVTNSSHVYLCVGLPYNHKVWQRDWEMIMNNVIDACIKHNVKLIFLDNIYMYAHELPVPFDEQTPQKPTSKKGKVRKKIADIFVEAYTNRGLKGLIARSADFYGKGAKNSVFYKSFLERIFAGKNPQLLSAGDVKHTFSYVDDNARAMVELALCEKCYHQVWHLPVGPPTTLNELLKIINEILKTDYKNSVMPNLLKKILPYFMPILKEPLEMQYQFETEFIMSFDKIKEQFPNFVTTPYEKGIKETIDYFLMERKRNTVANKG